MPGPQLSEEEQRLNGLRALVRDPSFSSLPSPGDQLKVFQQHLEDTDPSFASLPDDPLGNTKSKMARDFLAELRPDWKEKLANAAEYIPVVGGAIQGGRAYDAGQPQRYFTEKIFGPAQSRGQAMANEALRDVGELIGTGIAAGAVVKTGAKMLFGKALEEGVAGALSSVAADAATTAAAQVGKTAVRRKFWEEVATNVGAGELMGGIQAMERGEVKPFEDFVMTPAGVGALGIAFHGMGMAVKKFGQYRTQRILQSIEGLNDPAFAQFLQTDGPAFVNTVKKATGMDTEAAANFAEKVATTPVSGDEANLIRGIFKTHPEILNTEIGQHILRMQRDAVTRTEIQLKPEGTPVTIHYEPLVDDPTLGFKKRWDKTETNLTPERFWQLAEANRQGKIVVHAMEGPQSTVMQMPETVIDQGKPFLQVGVSPGGKKVMLDPNVTPDAIPDLPDFYGQPPRESPVVDEFGRPMQVDQPPISREGFGLPAVIQQDLRVEMPTDADSYARLWQRQVLEHEGLNGRTPAEVLDALEAGRFGQEGFGITRRVEWPVDKLSRAQREVDDMLFGIGDAKAYERQGLFSNIEDIRISEAPSETGRYTRDFTGTSFDIGKQTAADIAEGVRPGMPEAKTRARESAVVNTAVTPALERVVERYKTKGPPKSISPQLYQAAKDAALSDKEIGAYRASGDVKGLLEELVTRLDKMKGGSKGSVEAAEHEALSNSPEDILRALGLTRDDYARAVVERAGYAIDADTGLIVTSTEIAGNPNVRPLAPISGELERLFQNRARPIRGLLGTDIGAVGPRGDIHIFTPKGRNAQGHFTPAVDAISPNDLEFIINKQGSAIFPEKQITRADIAQVQKMAEAAGTPMTREQAVQFIQNNRTPRDLGNPPFIAETAPGQAHYPGPPPVGSQITLTSGEKATVIGTDMARAVLVKTEDGRQIKALLDQSGNLKIHKALLKRAEDIARYQEKARKYAQLERLRQYAGERNIKPGQEIYIMEPEPRLVPKKGPLERTAAEQRAVEEAKPEAFEEVRNPDFLYRITKVEGDQVTLVGGITETPVEIPIVNILSALEDGDVRLAEWIHPSERASSLGVTNLTRREGGVVVERGVAGESSAGQWEGKVGTTFRGNRLGELDDFVGMMEEEYRQRFSSGARDVVEAPVRDAEGNPVVRKMHTVHMRNAETGLFEPVQVPEYVMEAVTNPGDKASGARRRMAVGMLNLMDESLARKGEILDREILKLEGEGAKSRMTPGEALDNVKKNAAEGKTGPSKKCP